MRNEILVKKMEEIIKQVKVPKMIFTSQFNYSYYDKTILSVRFDAKTKIDTSNVIVNDELDEVFIKDCLVLKHDLKQNIYIVTYNYDSVIWSAIRQIKEKIVNELMITYTKHKYANKLKIWYERYLSNIYGYDAIKDIINLYMYLISDNGKKQSDICYALINGYANKNGFKVKNTKRK